MAADSDDAGHAPPGWLVEEPWLQELLNALLDRLDKPRQRDVVLRVKKKTIPALFHFSENTRYRWYLLEQLASRYQVFCIHYDRHLDSHQERYENAQLRLNPASEDLLRSWLDRPRGDPVLLAWQQAIETLQDRFCDGGAALLADPPQGPDWNPLQLATAFAEVGRHLDGTLSLRELAARCFRGDSKFLDRREDLLGRLFGERSTAIQPRPLLLSAWAPGGFQQLLIVENQDSFLRLAESPPAGYALLYSGGFRASAQRLVSTHTRFAFLPGSDARDFQARWLDGGLPAFFWGDLDFSGLGILKALRQSMPALCAWEPGYQAMLEWLEQGRGHSPGQARKGGQIDPVETGCSYSDGTLLPALRRHQCFVDQEAVRPPSIGRR